MKLASRIGAISGTSIYECHFLAYRFEEEAGLLDDTSETWVMQIESRQLHPVFKMTGPIMGLWRSPAKHAYVVSNNTVYVNRDPRPRGSPFEEHVLPCTLRGIWGLDDGFVLAWGESAQGQAIYRWDGKKWSPMPCPGYVRAIHGISPDLIYAVGEQAMIARWDGRAWTRLTAPLPGHVSGIFVAGQDEMYALGKGNHLYSGSIYGWSLCLEHTSGLNAVAKYGQTVYVSTREEGLTRLEGNKLLPLEPEMKVLYFDVRDKLVVSCADRIAEQQPDGKFKPIMEDPVNKMMAESPPMWLGEGAEYD